MLAPTSSVAALPSITFRPCDVSPSFSGLHPALIALAVLRRPGFLTYLSTAIPTLTGVWILENTLQWNVLTVSGSSTAVGVLWAAIFLPIVLLAVPVGLFIDRYGPRWLMWGSQVAWGGVMVAGAVLSHGGHLSVPATVGLGVLDGVCNATWSVPAQVMVGRVVKKELMADAIGLGLLQFAAGRIFGGALAALSLTPTGPGRALELAAACVLVGLVAGSRLRENQDVERRSAAPAWGSEVLEAFRWTAANPAAISLVALGAMCAVFASGYITLLPAVSRDLLHAGPGGLGAMTAAGGLGLALAAFGTGPAWRRLGQGATTCVAMGTAGVGLAFLAIWSAILPAAATVCLIAACLGIFTASNNSLIQAVSPPAMRGRVLSFYGLAVWLAFPVGTVLAGVAVDRVGLAEALVAMAVLTISGVLLSVVRYRPIVDLGVDLTGVATRRARPLWVSEASPR